MIAMSHFTYTFSPLSVSLPRCIFSVTLMCTLFLLLAGCGSHPAPPHRVTVGENRIYTHDKIFKGIYEFAGHKRSMDVTNPALAGTYLGYYWKQLEPQKGYFNWNLVDQDM